MNVMIFEGYMGAGKTLGASILAKYYQERSGCALYSNYGLVGSKPFKSIEDFLSIAQEPSSILVLDEAHIDLDARSFSTNHVKFFTQLSFYLRKLRCTLIITSPLFENLDSRIRGVTNVLIRVHKDKDYFYYPMYDVQSLKPLKTLKIHKKKAFAIAGNLFSTEAMVTPIYVPDKKGDYFDFLEQLKQTSDEYYTRLRRRVALGDEEKRERRIV
jgi:ATPase family associated with various cellular activities (AAA)